jgi:hypothetical protein
LPTVTLLAAVAALTAPLGADALQVCVGHYVPQGQPPQQRRHAMWAQGASQCDAAQVMPLGRGPCGQQVTINGLGGIELIGCGRPNKLLVRGGRPFLLCSPVDGKKIACNRGKNRGEFTSYLLCK